MPSIAVIHTCTFNRIWRDLLRKLFITFSTPAKIHAFVIFHAHHVLYSNRTTSNFTDLSRTIEKKTFSILLFFARSLALSLSLREFYCLPDNILVYTPLCFECTFKCFIEIPETADCQLLKLFNWTKLTQNKSLNHIPQLKAIISLFPTLGAELKYWFRLQSWAKFEKWPSMPWRQRNLHTIAVEQPIRSCWIFFEHLVKCVSQKIERIRPGKSE